MLPEPELLILDEPFTGLDPEGCAIVEDVVREMTAAGNTVILVTHELSRAMDLADAVMVLQKGKVVYSADDGSWDEKTLLEVYQ